MDMFLIVKYVFEIWNKYTWNNRYQMYVVFSVYIHKYTTNTLYI